MSAADTPPRAASRPSLLSWLRGWRALGVFWAVVLLLLAGGAGVLDFLGPPTHAHAPAAAGTGTPAPAAHAAVAGRLPPLAIPGAATPPAVAGPSAAPPAAVVRPVVSHAPGTIAPPQPALEEASKAYPGSVLPRIGADRVSPMQAYAAAADPAEARPRIAILMAGIGLSASQSEDAIASLPGAVSLAVSPYAYRPQALLAEARARGHEYLVSIPMEPQGYPLDDAGDHALMTGNTDAKNLSLLDWALSRFAGYVGATGALGGGLRGERFAASPPQMAPVMAELAARGLLYVDPRPGAARPPEVVGRGVDLVLDEPAVRTEIEAKLARLEQIARDRGSAIGLAGLPRPVTVDRIAAWANTLATRGLALMPVSAVAPIVPPPGPKSAAALSGAGAP